MNKIMLMGTVMYDPQQNSLPDGRPVVNVKVKTRKGLDINRNFSDESKYDIFQLVFMGCDIDPVVANVHAGDLIGATGILNVKTKILPHGNERIYLNVRVDNWELAPQEEHPVLKRPRFLDYGENDIEWE